MVAAPRVLLSSTHAPPRRTARLHLAGSLVLETDASVVAGRVTMRGAEAEIPLAEQVGAVGV